MRRLVSIDVDEEPVRRKGASRELHSNVQIQYARENQVQIIVLESITVQFILMNTGIH